MPDVIDLGWFGEGDTIEVKKDDGTEDQEAEAEEAGRDCPG